MLGKNYRKNHTVGNSDMIDMKEVVFAVSSYYYFLTYLHTNKIKILYARLYVPIETCLKTSTKVRKLSHKTH